MVDSSAMSPDIDRGNKDRSINVNRLVNLAILVRPDKARKASRELTKGIIESGSYNHVFSAIEEVQKILLSSSDPNVLKRGAEFLRSFLFLTGSGIEGGKALELELTPALATIIEKIKQSHEKITTKPFLVSILPRNYVAMIDYAIPFVEDGFSLEAPKMQMKFNPPLRDGEDRGERDRKTKEDFEATRRWSAWMIELKENPHDNKDKLVDLLKNEPIDPIYKKEPFYKRRYADLTLSDIFQMTFPLSEENYEKVTNYLAAATKDNLDYEFFALTHLFFQPTVFYDVEKKAFLEYRHQDIFKVLNTWNEKFLFDLLYETDPEKLVQIKNIISGIPHLSRVLPGNLMVWTIAPSQISPVFNRAGTVEEEMRKRHPFLDQAISYRQHKTRTNLSLPSIISEEEVGEDYLLELALPGLRERLKEFGLLDSFEEDIKKIEDWCQKNSYEKSQLGIIKKFYEKDAGPEFLDKLAVHSSELKTISDSVWSSIMENGAHFLPMSEGVNTINFSENSVAKILGLDSLRFMKSMDDLNFYVTVGFAFKKDGLDTVNVVGVLDKDGFLRVRVPIDKETPGLYFILRHIAILAFHDLIIQTKKEPEISTEKVTIDAVSDENGERKTRSKSKSQSKGISLPREQRDTELIADVYKKTGYKPRRVELHKRLLNGAREYRLAIDLLEESIKDPNASEETREWYRRELNNCRVKLHRTSEEKIKNLPPLFRLASLQDPITGEERYIETWVVEHTSPKPTPEELQSPVKLYERYYRNSSALASLDQLKPWFVGQ